MTELNTSINKAKLSIFDYIIIIAFNKRNHLVIHYQIPTVYITLGQGYLLCTRMMLYGSHLSTILTWKVCLSQQHEACIFSKTGTPGWGDAWPHF